MEKNLNLNLNLNEIGRKVTLFYDFKMLLKKVHELMRNFKTANLLSKFNIKVLSNISIIYEENNIKIQTLAFIWNNGNRTYCVLNQTLSLIFWCSSSLGPRKVDQFKCNSLFKLCLEARIFFFSFFKLEL